MLILPSGVLEIVEEACGARGRATRLAAALQVLGIDAGLVSAGVDHWLDIRVGSDLETIGRRLSIVLGVRTPWGTVGPCGQAWEQAVLDVHAAEKPELGAHGEWVSKTIGPPQPLESACLPIADMAPSALASLQQRLRGVTEADVRWAPDVTGQMEGETWWAKWGENRGSQGHLWVGNHLWGALQELGETGLPADGLSQEIDTPVNERTVIQERTYVLRLGGQEKHEVLLRGRGVATQWRAVTYGGSRQAQPSVRAQWLNPSENVKYAMSRGAAGSSGMLDPAVVAALAAELRQSHRRLDAQARARALELALPMPAGRPRARV